MFADWLNIVGQLLSVVLGGALVIAANYLTHRHERRLEEQKQDDRNAALFTAVFTVRNFLLKTLNEWESHKNVYYINVSFRTALENLQSIIEKSPPDTQYVMSALYEISLTLGDVIAASEPDGFDLHHFEQRVEYLEQAIELFDLVAPRDLHFTTDEEIAALVENPEDVAVQAASGGSDEP